MNPATSKSHCGRKSAPARLVRVAFVACLAYSPAVCAASAGEIWFQLYSAPHRAPLTQMRAGVRAGPFPDTTVCYSVGALSIEALNNRYPAEDFMGRCGDGDLLTMHQMTDRALSILNLEESHGRP